MPRNWPRRRATGFSVDGAGAVIDLGGYGSALRITENKYILAVYPWRRGLSPGIYGCARCRKLVFGPAALNDPISVNVTCMKLSNLV